MQNIRKKGKGSFIVIEGIDASGKGTQSDKVVEKLKDKGEEVEYIDFPKYDTKFGSLISKYLRGEFGEKDEIPVEIRCMLYAMDRYQFKEHIQEALDKEKIIISDRYIESNLGYQTAEHKGKEREELIKWIETVEGRLPQSDLVIFLDVSPKEAYELHDQKSIREYMGNDKRDIHESVSEFQEKVYNNYHKLAEEKENWTIVNCVENGELKNIEEIHEEIMNKLEEHIN
ncbi:MAG: dTMP kinase [archaeon]